MKAVSKCPFCTKPCREKWCPYNEIEEAAIRNVANLGQPDISGGIVIDKEAGTVYFKDKHGSTSVRMSIDTYNQFVQAITSNDENGG